MLSLTDTAKIVAEKLNIPYCRVVKIFNFSMKIAYEKFVESDDRFQLRMPYIGKIYLYQKKREKEKNGEN